MGDETRRVDNEECANVRQIACPLLQALAKARVVLTQDEPLFERTLDIQKNQIGCAERIAGLFREQPRHLVRVFVGDGDRLMPATPDDPGNQYFNQHDARYGKDANASDLRRGRKHRRYSDARCDRTHEAQGLILIMIRGQVQAVLRWIKPLMASYSHKRRLLQGDFAGSGHSAGITCGVRRRPRGVNGVHQGKFASFVERMAARVSPVPRSDRRRSVAPEAISSQRASSCHAFLPRFPPPPPSRFAAAARQRRLRQLLRSPAALRHLLSAAGHPAAIPHRERDRMVAPGRRVAHRIPARYETVMVPKTVMVAPEGVAYEEVPPQYATVQRTEIVAPARPTWFRCARAATIAAGSS